MGRFFWMRKELFLMVVMCSGKELGVEGVDWSE
jgi:hypothetical protein